MKKSYVLIDFENVQPGQIGAVEKGNFHILVFVGASQTKISLELASALQKFGDRAEYYKISGNGKNALDFHIAYYLGIISAKETDAVFHIISKDTGFDPLVAHLQHQSIRASRWNSLSDIPDLLDQLPPTTKQKTSKAAQESQAPVPVRTKTVKNAAAASAVSSILERVLKVRENLEHRATGKPKTLASLRSTINALFQKTLNEQELTAVVNGLKKQGLIVVSNDKIEYKKLKKE